MIKYLGSKRTIVPRILAMVRALPDVRSVCDLFTGTTRVASALKRAGLRVTANDLATYSHELALAHVALDRDAADLPRLEALLAHLDALPGTDGYVTETFCRQARYFQPHNGRRIDAVRDEIDRLDLARHERAVLLTSLLLAADRVDSTTGLQMAYLKTWSPRSHERLALRLPDLLPGPGQAHRMDAHAFVDAGGTRGVDLTYLDPPYNQHSYAGNYHVWETLVRNDRPETYGVARKRIDTKQNRSVFNSAPRHRDALARLVAAVESPYLLVSFNSEGYLSRDEVLAILGEKGHVAHVEIDVKRYVGAQIGIHNPSGEKVGTVSHLRNREYLFLVGPSRTVVESATSRLPAPDPRLALAL